MKISSLTTLGLLAAGVASAQIPKSAATFSDLDADRNGRIDVYEAEADKRVLESFNRLDANRDGLLSSDEFALLEKLEKQTSNRR